MKTVKDIAKRNDDFRKSLKSDANHKVVLTSAVADDPSVDKIIERVKDFDSFSSANDPHGEHDFGSFEINGEKYFFKIDYYDLDFNYGADPKEDEYSCLLTIMQASDY
jgi:hypothetical protein